MISRASRRRLASIRSGRNARACRPVLGTSWGPLERRALLAAVTLSGNTLVYQAAEGEANALTIDVVPLGGSRYLRLSESGPGVTLSPTGTGLIADSTTVVRALASAVGFLEVRLSDGADAVTFAPDAQSLVLRITILADDASSFDTLTLRGTTAADALSLGAYRHPGDINATEPVEGSGAKGTLASYGPPASRPSVALIGIEHLTVDLSGNGPDTLTVDRYIAGLDRPLALNVVGGGSGADSLEVVAEGNVAQIATIVDGGAQISQAPGANEVFLGRSDNITIDQPKVAIEVIDDSNPNNLISFGPEAFNTFLLDTGATGVVVASEATYELRNSGLQVYNIPYDEQGVAGFTPFDISHPYRFDFAGASGERNTLDDMQIMTSETLSFSFFGPWGIVGMPAMVNRVTTIDMTGWHRLQDLEDLGLKTDFSMDAPANAPNRYHVPLELVDFPANGRRPGGPAPTFAPLPFITTNAQDDGHVVHGRWLVDTGAQLSIISSATAFALGLDKNHDGNFNQESLGFLEVGGIGGTTQIPVLAFDRVSVPTAEGPELVWTNMLVGVEDIEVEDGPEIAGVFGMDFLTSGWAARVLPALLGQPGSEEDGYFQRIAFDFRDAPNHRGTAIFEVTPERNIVTPTKPLTLAVTHAGLTNVVIRGGDGDDRFFVTPSTTVRYQLDGKAHSAGDRLQLVPDGLNATDNGSTIQVAGYQNIDYERIEFRELQTGVATFRALSAPQPTPSGFTIAFNRPADDASLSLYFDAPDLIVTGPDGPVRGSLVLSPDGASAQFVATSGPLPDGTYTVRLRSAADALRDGNGALLDGNGDGTSGDDLVASFVIAGQASRAVVGLPHFARGPGQTVAVPADSAGLPLQVTRAAGLTTLTAEIVFDPDLIAITGATRGPDAPSNAVVGFTALGPGRVRVTYSSATPLSAGGTLRLIELAANVPTNAPYRSKQVIALENLALNGGNLAALASPSIAAVAYFGDTTGDGGYSGLDAALLQRLVLGMDSGLSAAKLLDPLLLADITANGRFSGMDVVHVMEATLGRAQSLIPPRPTNVTVSPGGPDPKISLPRGLKVASGGTVTVPVTFEQTEPSGQPVPLQSIDLAIDFDPRRFRILDVTAGPLIEGFTPGWTVDEAAGRLLVSAWSAEPLTIDAGTIGVLLNIEIEVRSDAPAGRTVLNLRQSAITRTGRYQTGLNERGLTLSPAPTDRPTDAVDGTLFVRSRTRPPRGPFPFVPTFPAPSRTIASRATRARVAAYARPHPRPLPAPFVTTAPPRGTAMGLETARKPPRIGSGSPWDFGRAR